MWFIFYTIDCFDIQFSKLDSMLHRKNSVVFKSKVLSEQLSERCSGLRNMQTPSLLFEFICSPKWNALLQIDRVEWYSLFWTSSQRGWKTIAIWHQIYGYPQHLLLHRSCAIQIERKFRFQYNEFSSNFFRRCAYGFSAGFCGDSFAKLVKRSFTSQP